MNGEMKDAEPPEGVRWGARAQVGGRGGFYDSLLMSMASSRYLNPVRIPEQDGFERRRVD
jgi:hypothetical protein